MALAPFIGLAACTVMAEYVEGNKDLAYLNDQKVLALEFRYPDPQATIELRESDYVKKKKMELNSEKEGKGDLFEKEWHQNKKEIYEPAFIEAMNEELEEDPLKIQHQSSDHRKRPVKGIVKVESLEPGRGKASPMKVETHMFLKERESGEVLTELKYETTSFDSALIEKSFHLQFKKAFKESGERYGLWFDREESALEDGER